MVLPPEFVREFNELRTKFNLVEGQDDRLHPLAREYEGARVEFELERYPESAQKAELLLQKLLGKIIKDNHMTLSQDGGFQKAFREIAASAEEVKPKPAGGPVGPRTWALADLCVLFDQVDVWGKLDGEIKKHAELLRSFVWGNLRILCALCKNVNQPDKSLAALGVQQVLCAITALLRACGVIQVTPYYLLANFTHMTNEISNIQKSQSKLMDTDSELSYLRSRPSDTGLRTFHWIKFRGMLLNPSDNSRNISFKVETLVSIFSTVHEGITKWCKPAGEGEVKSKYELASRLLFEAGYRSGSRFGWTMHDTIQKEHPELELRDRIEKWCDFDSDVGFGRFSVEHLQEEPRTVEEVEFIYYRIDIRLSFSFLTYRQGKKDVNLCSFMSGYIRGVLEGMTGQPLEVTHSVDECEQYVAGRDFCTYHVKTKVEQLVNDRRSIRGLFPAQYTPEGREDSDKRPDGDPE